MGLEGRTSVWSWEVELGWVGLGGRAGVGGAGR